MIGMDLRRIMADWKLVVVSGLCVTGLSFSGWAAEGDPGFDPALGAQPGAGAQAPFQPMQFPGQPASSGLPGMPQLPGLAPAPSYPTAPAPTDTGGGINLSGGIPQPPPLPSLAGFEDMGSSGTTEQTTAPTAQGPIDTYAFLFRDDTELGVVREKYRFEEAEERKNQEIQRLLPKYLGGGQGGYQPGGYQPGYQQQQGQDPRAGAEWDFYYEQLELYNSYVHQRVLPGAEDLPTPQYDAQNYLQERNDLKASFDKAAINYVNKQHDENLAFYERLQTREDRRRAYYEWLASQQRDLDEWARLWARKVDGTRVTIDGHVYLVSAAPLQNVATDELNVVTPNLTPYDIIDRNGALKTPELERLRGSFVHPPVESVTTTGTVELATP